MAELRKIKHKKERKVETKQLLQKKASEPSVDRLHGRPYLTDTSFNPGIEHHARLFRHALDRSDTAAQHLVINLQQAYGNGYVQRLLSSHNIQASLKISNPNDAFEQEADKVSEQVTGNQNQAVQKQEDEEAVQTKSTGVQTAPENDELESRINSARGSGQGLTDEVKDPMEKAFGADFSKVQIHTGSEAGKLSKSINAKAFTTGSDIFFGENEYRPGSHEGQKLIAHELTHVVQQTGTQSQVSRAKKKKEEAPKTGIASTKALEKFGGNVKAIYDNWEKLSPGTRLTFLVMAVNIELLKAGVPMVKIATADMGGPGNAEFDFVTWTVKVDPTTANKDSVTVNEMAQLADAVYHESRHAEQWFRVARLRAGEGIKADKLAQELFIPSNIAEAAVANPLKPLSAFGRLFRSKQALKLHDQSLKEAKSWYDSIYGKDAPHRNEVLGDIDNRYNEYRALSEEVDAWAAGTAAQEVVKKFLGG